MSVHAAERVRQIMDCLVSEKITPLVLNNDAIQLVERNLADQQSRDAYEREFVFMALSAMLGAAGARQFAGNFDESVWEKALESVNGLLESKKIPSLAVPYLPSGWELPYLYAATFVMRQYAYGPITVKENDVVLDCGANFGEAAIWALQSGARQVHAFEGNPAAFGFLQQNADSFGEKKISSLNVVPRDSEESVTYKLEDGESTVPGITLDSWCEKEGVTPDFIKMSLESTTLHAIVGAQNTIKTVKPRMAILLSPAIANMWNVPLALKQICPEYQIVCRKAAPLGDFVLYAGV